MNKRLTQFLCHALTFALIACSSAWAQVPCEITDPVGDFLGFAGGTINSNPCQGPGSGCEPWLDIVSASALKQGGSFHFSVTVAEAVPPAPPLRPGAKRDIWAWNLDTDPTTSPKGFPFDPSTVAPPEFIVRVIWNGASFSAVLIDRRPLLSGGEASVVPVLFEVNGTQVSAVVDQSLLGNVSSLAYRAATQSYTAYDETGGFLAEDRTNPAQCAW
jgi:hypothetical protein